MNKSIEVRLEDAREFCPKCDRRVNVTIVPDLLTGEKGVKVHCPAGRCDYSENPFADEGSKP